MKKWKRFWQNLWTKMFIFSGLILCSPFLEAARPAKVDNAEGIKAASTSIWVVPYILVIMAIILGALVLCSPVKRRDKKLTDDF
ncbi:MAG: hypothetical protein Q4C96_06840 [Planctomycetia bacterium]|nr:hypothetical protein [Planctomycetia bacterium]